MRKFSHFYKTVKFLKENIDFEKNISVRRTKIRKGLDGYCTFKNDEFHIRINKELSEESALDCFLHEISHVLSWNKELDEHGIAWGKAYSFVYRKFLEMK